MNRLHDLNTAFLNYRKRYSDLYSDFYLLEFSGGGPSGYTHGKNPNVQQ